MKVVTILKKCIEVLKHMIRHIDGVSSSFCWRFASDVNYVNNKSKSGIKADCPWTLLGYKIKKQ